MKLYARSSILLRWVYTQSTMPYRTARMCLELIVWVNVMGDYGNLNCL